MLALLPAAALAQRDAAAVRAPWPRHTIDASSQGADGVRLHDVDGDGDLDIATGWEEGNVVRAYLNPGPAGVKRAWPAVTVGEVRSAEDAVFCDLDGDGSFDVVSCCEGETRTVFFHWAPARERWLDANAWRTEAVPCTEDRQQWMFCLPMQVDGRRGTDLVVGGKGKAGTLGWLESPLDPRDTAAWRYHELGPAGWTMSLEAIDMDGDGDLDVLLSDRERKLRGVRWLENPGAEAARTATAWTTHRIGGRARRVKFLTATGLDRSAAFDILAATRNGEIIRMRKPPGDDSTWEHSAIPNPFAIPWGKSVRIGDIDLDGELDIVHSGNNQRQRGVPTLTWMRRVPVDGNEPEHWQSFDLGGERGSKYDLVELLDLDADGDLDCLTCEEWDGLGVIWYENPAR